MKGLDWLSSLTAPPPPITEPTWWDLMARAETYGRGRGGQATRWLAGQMGVTVRTAERYLTAEFQPTKPATVARADAAIARIRSERELEREQLHRRETSDFLRLIDRIDPGTILVVSLSAPNATPSKRTPRVLDQMGAGMARVAQLWEQGARYAAENALSDAVIARYGRESSGNRYGLAATLRIVDYSSITYG